MLPITPRAAELVRRDVDGPGSFYWSRQGYRQPKPYNKPAPFRLHRKETLSGYWLGSYVLRTGSNVNSGYGGNLINTMVFAPNTSSSDAQAVLNKARAKFMDAISDSAQAAVNLAEHHQTSGMLFKRIAQLQDFTRAVKRGDLIGAGGALGLANVFSARERVRNSLQRKGLPVQGANLWLEYHFGWEPLVKDIGSAIDLLQKPINDRPIVKRARTQKVLATPYSTTGFYGTEAYRSTHSMSWTATVGGKFRITNPNLFLANRLGLANPLSVAWELVPFSFVVDWFVNVSEFLGQFNELLGIELIDTFYTQSERDMCACDWTIVGNRNAPPGFDGAKGWSTTSLFIQRQLGLPSVTLGIRPPWRLSVSRGATAISLLLQQMSNLKR